MSTTRAVVSAYGSRATNVAHSRSRARKVGRVGALTISADGRKPGTGIVWATLTVSRSADHGNAAGVLRAYDAGGLQELWHSEMQPRRDRLGTLVKFVPPTVIAGRVYVPNYDNAVNVYGLLQAVK